MRFWPALALLVTACSAHPAAQPVAAPPAAAVFPPPPAHHFHRSRSTTRAAIARDVDKLDAAVRDRRKTIESGP
jgi:hypothetical protein